MTTTLAPDLLAQARHAMDEYNAAYEAGGELDYPAWAADVLKACEQAEELTRRIEALGRKE